MVYSSPFSSVKGTARDQQGSPTLRRRRATSISATSGVLKTNPFQSVTSRRNSFRAGSYTTQADGAGRRADKDAKGTQGLTAQRTAARSSLPRIRPNTKRQGTLAPTDTEHPRRSGRFTDSYILQGVKRNQQVRVRVTSSNFDPFVEVINARTGRVILQNDDNGRNRNSRLSFVVQPGVTYQLRVSSFAQEETGRYTLSAKALTSSIKDFSFAYGHGLIDAEAAVRAALDLGSGAASKSAQANTQLDADQSSNSVPSDQWNLGQVKAPATWTQGIRGQGVVVAVIDSGVSINHPDLASNLWRNPGEIPQNGIDDDGNGFVDDVRGWDFIQNDALPRDASLHGTHVAGIVAAADNDIGITGVAPDASIMPVRVLNRNGSGTARGVAKGIRYAVRNGADVINLSLGAPPGAGVSRVLRRAIRFAHRKGVVVAIAAGNERTDLGTTQAGEPAFWAATRNLAIAVGAVNREREVASFSNPTGNRAVNSFVVAPGVDIDSLAALWLRNAFGSANVDLIEPLSLSGTSMATPHVAGVAALMLSANPNLTPDQVSQIITETANPNNLKAI